MSAEFIDTSSATSTTATDNHRRIVVGYDGSHGSSMAVEWAVREAAARASSLQVVSCWTVPADVDFYGVGQRQTDRLEAIVGAARRRHPSVVVGSMATNLDPRDELIEEAKAADLLVIGSSESGAARRLLLGSVTRTAARRSSCPVVIVPGGPSVPLRRIVVCADGSSASMIAQDWACEEAVLHGAELTVVHALEHVITRRDAEELVDVAVRECAVRSNVRAGARIVDGPAASALVEASNDADLMVIGSRGRSGFKTALFGSVALAVVQSAACPVAITHPRIRRT